MKYVVTLNGKDYEVEVDELSEAIVTSVAPTAASAPAAPVATQPSAPAKPPPPPLFWRDSRTCSCFRKRNRC